jgi:hypothetical protein
MKAVEQARRDIEGGRLWKARDRLQGAVRSRPHDQELLRLLGDVAFRMGDLPTAGRYWSLTESVGTEVDAAVEAMHERFGPGALGLARALPFRLSLLADETFISRFPPMVRSRLQGVASELRRTRPQFGDRAYNWKARQSMLTRSRLASTISSAVGTMVVVAFVGIWIFGLVTLLRALF